MKQIPLRRRDGSVRAYVLVDDSDFDWLNQWRWNLNSDGYAKRREAAIDHCRGRMVRMQRVIMEAPAHLEVDHINGNKLDNRRANLRLVSRGENQQNLRELRADNSSGYRGVARRPDGSWQAPLRLDGHLHWLGRHPTVEAANEAVLAFRREHMPFSAADQVGGE